MIPELNTVEVPDIDIIEEGSIDLDTTTATIFRYYSQINMNWDEGVQIASPSGEICSRTYSILDFPDIYRRIDVVDVGQYDDSYKGSKYIQVISNFTENEYYSSKDVNFSYWEYSINKYRQETVYSLEKVKELLWEKPVPVSYEEEVEIIPLPFILNVDVGSSLAYNIITNAPYSVYNMDSLQGLYLDPLIDSEVNLLIRRYLCIKFDTLVPQSVLIEFYGKELWRSIHPIDVDSDPSTIESVGDIYKPPTLQDIGNNFWNSRPSDERTMINREGEALFV